tara:strand:+ start:149 stop:286 length:138 start_codon:yes stop_codon:yes gene_type:complete
VRIVPKNIIIGGLKNIGKKMKKGLKKKIDDKIRKALENPLANMRK